MKLISMTDFVLEQDTIRTDDLYFRELCCNYANFLKQPLKLEMFVPCVDDEPFNYSKHGNKKEFEKAKEKVLFEVTSEFVYNNIYDDNGFFYTLENIESLIADYNNYNLTLTQNAIKQIGL